MRAKILLSCCLIALFSCSEAADSESTPEYWAEIIVAEGFSEDLYQRYRAVLDAKSLQERRAFQARVNELRGRQETPPIQESDYISYEEACFRMVEHINNVDPSRGDFERAISGLSSTLHRMKEMLDSPFRYYNDETVSLIPNMAMTDDQKRHLNFIERAVEYLKKNGLASNVLYDGAPLRLSEDEDEMRVLIGARSIKQAMPRIIDVYVVFDEQTGEPIMSANP